MAKHQGIRLISAVASVGCSIILQSVAAYAADPNPGALTGFPVELSGDSIRNGSVALGDVDGDDVADIVVGGIDGLVHAYDGSGSLLWTFDSGSMAIEGKAAIADIDGDGNAEVIIGAGSTHTPTSHGGLYVIDHLGVEQCHFDTTDITGDTWHEGVFSSPAVADLDGNDGGKLEIVFGAWDHYLRAIHHDCSLLWDLDAYDTIWSSPSIADLDGDGTLYVIVGADSHHEPQPIGTEDGGRMLVVNGATGAYRAGFPIQIDEVITSSPAVGDIDGDGYLDIVVGTGNCWAANNGCGVPYHAGVGEYVNAWDRNGTALAGWPFDLTDQYVVGSPALADMTGDGQLEVVFNTSVRESAPAAGWVYVVSGNGVVLPGWPVQPSTHSGCAGAMVHYSTPASPIVGDVNGDSELEVILPSNSELVVWGPDGEQLTVPALVPPICQPADSSDYFLNTAWALNGSAGIADVDDDGDLDLVVGGFARFNDNEGALWAWDFDGGSAAPTPWPQFREDAVNLAVIPSSLLFSGDFETGDFSGWSSVSP